MNPLSRTPAGAPRWVTPEPLNVAPELVGRPLATPARRALAMGVDLLVVALLSGVSGFWLLGGLALVVLQLRSRQGATTGRRLIMGWLGAGLITLLVLQEAKTQWDERHAPAVAAEADEDAAAPVPLPAPAASATAAVPAPAVPAPSAASAPSDAERIATLEAELAQARKPVGWRRQLTRMADEIGLGFGWGIVYFSLLPAWWGGQTVGKKLLRLRVVELTGKPMTVMRCLKRYGGYAAGLATGGIGLAQLLWDPNRQGLQDKAAHTVVVDLRAPAQAAPADAG